MDGFASWAKDLLVSRGALVEDESGEALGAMLPSALAKSLEAQEWLSLNFGAGPGRDDATEWLERFGRLLPAAPLVTSARSRRSSILRAVNAASVLDRELVIQNGIYRSPEERQGIARYYIFQFPYTVESDETSQGLCIACINASVNSVVMQPDALLRHVREEAEEETGADCQDPEIARVFPVALGLARLEVHRMATGIEMNANRRLARDSERIHSYYSDLLRQIGKRVTRHKGEPAAVAKEQSRAAATELDRTAKLKDLERKYALKIRIEPGDVLRISLPVREIEARLIRRKFERQARFHWNPVLGALESPWCEGCKGRAHPLFLCDDRAHFLCRDCQSPCTACGRQFCRACRPTCKCAAGGR